MTEMQAAIGRVQLTKLSDILEKRRSLVREYFVALKNCPTVSLPGDVVGHTWQTFMIVLNEPGARALVIEQLAAKGIEAGPGSVAGHLGGHFRPQPALKVSERLHGQGLALPLHAGLAASHVAACSEALRACWSEV